MTTRSSRAYCGFVSCVGFFAACGTSNEGVGSSSARLGGSYVVEARGHTGVQIIPTGTGDTTGVKGFCYWLMLHGEFAGGSDQVRYGVDPATHYFEGLASGGNPTTAPGGLMNCVAWSDIGMTVAQVAGIHTIFHDSMFAKSAFFGGPVNASKDYTPTTDFTLFAGVTGRLHAGTLLDESRVLYNTNSGTSNSVFAKEGETCTIDSTTCAVYANSWVFAGAGDNFAVAPADMIADSTTSASKDTPLAASDTSSVCWISGLFGTYGPSTMASIVDMGGQWHLVVNGYGGGAWASCLPVPVPW